MILVFLYILVHFVSFRALQYILMNFGTIYSFQKITYFGTLFRFWYSSRISSLFGMFWYVLVRFRTLMLLDTFSRVSVHLGAFWYNSHILIILYSFDKFQASRWFFTLRRIFLPFVLSGIIWFNCVHFTNIWHISIHFSALSAIFLFIFFLYFTYFFYISVNFLLWFLFVHLMQFGPFCYIFSIIVNFDEFL